MLAIPPAATTFRGAGRPRSEATRQKILDATMALLDSETIQSISIEAIAKEAAVSKATIYRWWTSKALVVLDAFIEHHLIHTPMRHDLPPGQAIAHHLRLLIRQYIGKGGRIVAQLIAEGQSDPEIGRAFRERFHYGRRAIVRETLEEWRRCGGIDEKIPVELLMDLLYAPTYLRLMVGHSQLSDDFACNFIKFVYGLLGPAAEADALAALEDDCEPAKALKPKPAARKLADRAPKPGKLPD